MERKVERAIAEAEGRVKDLDEFLNGLGLALEPPPGADPVVFELTMLASQLDVWIRDLDGRVSAAAAALTDPRLRDLRLRGSGSFVGYTAAEGLRTRLKDIAGAVREVLTHAWRPGSAEFPSGSGNAIREGVDGLRRDVRWIRDALGDVEDDERSAPNLKEHVVESRVEAALSRADAALENVLAHVGEVPDALDDRGMPAFHLIARNEARGEVEPWMASLGELLKTALSALTSPAVLEVYGRAASDAARMKKAFDDAERELSSALKPTPHDLSSAVPGMVDRLSKLPLVNVRNSQLQTLESTATRARELIHEALKGLEAPKVEPPVRAPEPTPSPPLASFPFIQDADYRRIAERDASSLATALAAGDVKWSVACAGFIVETICCDLIDRDIDVAKDAAGKAKAVRGEFRNYDPEDPDRWDFSNKIVICGPTGLKAFDARVEKAAHYARDWRNFVHPAKEKKLPTPLSGADVSFAVALLELVVDEVEACWRKADPRRPAATYPWRSPRR